MTITFGSKEALRVVKADKQVRAEAKKTAHLSGLPMRRWVVSVEVTQNCYVDARTEEEAIAICKQQYDGEPYDAMPMGP